MTLAIVVYYGLEQFGSRRYRQEGEKERDAIKRCTRNAKACPVINALVPAFSIVWETGSLLLLFLFLSPSSYPANRCAYSHTQVRRCNVLDTHAMQLRVSRKHQWIAAWLYIKHHVPRFCLCVFFSSGLE